MKRMAALFLSIALLSSCAAQPDADSSRPEPTMAPVDIDVSDVELPEDGIICLIRHVNWAEGYQDYGSFICTDGKVFTFDFSTYTYGSQDDDEYADDLFGKLDLIRHNAEPETVLEPERVKAIYSEGVKIGSGETFTTESAACDAGSSTVTFCDPVTGNQVCLSEYGDYEGALKNKHAEKIRELVQNILPWNTNRTKLCTVGAISSDRGICEPSDCEGNYLLLSTEQLDDLAEKSGCPVDRVLRSDRDRGENRSFFAVIKNYKKGDKVPVPRGLISGSGKIGIACDGEETMTGDCCFWYVFVYNKGNDVMVQDLEDFSGNLWTVPAEHDVNSDPLFFAGFSDELDYDKCSELCQQYRIGWYDGIRISTQEEYDELVAYCDSIGLTGEASADDIFTSSGTPDFSKGSLFMKPAFTDYYKEMKQGRVLITDSAVILGDSVNALPMSACEIRREYLSYAFIPDEYIPETDDLRIC